MTMVAHRFRIKFFMFIQIFTIKKVFLYRYMLLHAFIDRIFLLQF